MILLSFDIEEFDMPFEYGREIPFDEQISISKQGTEKILQLLAKHEVKATFYTTANFAQHEPILVQNIVTAGHELASHGFYHNNLEIKHLKESKDLLEKIGNVTVKGYRMARMMPVSESEIYKAGYTYNSSINPTFIPGRYNNFNEPRTYFIRENVWQLPASVSPVIRFPLFWLSFQNLPLTIYQYLAKQTYKKDKYLNVYFHPWEFMPIGQEKRFNIPGHVTRNTGQTLVDRLEKFILWAKKNNYPFGLTRDFIQGISSTPH